MIQNSHKSCDRCTNRFCQSISSESRAKLHQASYWVNYNFKNEQIVFFGGGHLFILESGALMTIRSNAEGKRQGIDILKPGDILGIVQLFNSDYKNSISVLPLSSVSGCMIPINTVEKLILENSDISTAILAHYSQRFSRVLDHLTINSMGTSKDKLDFALGTANESDIKQLTHEELAILSGLNRVTVTRTIREIINYTEEDIDKFCTK